MSRDYLGFVRGLHRTYGDATFMRIGRERAYDFFAPELMREVLVDQADAFARWERGADVLAQGLGRSILVTDGQLWQRQRRMLQPAFAPKRLDGYAGLMVAAARKSLQEALPAAGPATLDVERLMAHLTMDVILRVLFGSEIREEAVAAAEAVQTLSQTAMREMYRPMTLPDWLPLPGKAQKRRALRTMHGLVERHIQARQARQRAAGCDPATPDILDTLLAIRDESGAGLAQTELHDQCLVLFQAGHETTATALIWWCRLIAEHRDQAQELREEVDRVLGGRDPAPADMPALPHLAASLHEAMRLYPPVAAMMTRRALRAVRIGNWLVPRGALVRITPWIAHHDPRWFPEPEAFRPQRFAAGTNQAPRGAWIPFGAGPRVCLGQNFAMLEMTLVAAMLLQHVELTTLPGDPRPDVALNVTLRPRGGMKLRFERRSGPARPAGADARHCPSPAA